MQELLTAMHNPMPKDIHVASEFAHQVALITKNKIKCDDPDCEWCPNVKNLLKERNKIDEKLKALGYEEVANRR
jgi:hypothetical protein